MRIHSYITMCYSHATIAVNMRYRCVSTVSSSVSIPQECYKLIHQLLLEYLDSFQESQYENFSRIE